MEMRRHGGEISFKSSMLSYGNKLIYKSPHYIAKLSSADLGVEGTIHPTKNIDFFKKEFQEILLPISKFKLPEAKFPGTVATLRSGLKMYPTTRSKVLIASKIDVRYIAYKHNSAWVTLAEKKIFTEIENTLEREINDLVINGEQNNAYLGDLGTLREDFSIGLMHGLYDSFLIEDSGWRDFLKMIESGHKIL